MKHRLFISALFLLLCFAFDSSAQRITDSEENSYRIMSYNIRNGMGVDDRLDLNRISNLILRMKPDVVAIQEVDSLTGRSGGVDVLREIANETLMYPLFSAAISFDGGKYGLGVLSKEKPISSYSLSLPGKEEKRTVLIVEFEKFIFANTHFSLTEEDRLASVDIIRKEAEKAEKAFILAGDLNDTPDSPVMETFKKDFSILSNGQPTYPADKPEKCIDYLLTGKAKESSFTKLSSFVVNEPVASDHRPIVMDIRFHAQEKDIFYAAPYLQNPVGGGITVMWQTRVPTYSWVEYGTDTLNLKQARTIVDGQVICNDLYNKIRLDGIEPGKTYYYRVCSQEILLYEAYKKIFGNTATSPFYSFTLPQEKEKDFTALIFNDLHKQEVTLRTLYECVKDIPYDFVFFNGDCIDDPANEAEALHHMAIQCGIVEGSSHPVFYIRGNHEIRNAYSIKLRDLFDYVNDKTYNAFNWGDTRFVILDCGEDKPDSTWVYYGLNDFTQLRKDQQVFLEKEIVSPAYKKASKRVLINHIPLWLNADAGAYQPSSALWKETLKKASFNVNISAHNHRHACYKKDESGNRFPLVIGGGPELGLATVMVLQRKGNEMTLRVLNAKGEVIYDLKL